MNVNQISKLLHAFPKIFFTNGVMYFNEKMEVVFFRFKEDIGIVKKIKEYYFLDKGFLYHRNNGLLAINIFTNEKRVLFPEFHFAVPNPNNQLILSKYPENNLICYDTITGTILWDIQSNACNIYYDSEDFFVTQAVFQEGHIATYDKRTGSLLWELDVSEYGCYEVGGKKRAGNLRRVIGMYEDVLLCIISDRKLVALNPKTGDIVWDISSGLNIYGEPSNILPQAYYLKWSSDKTKLYALKNSMFVEIDLATRSVIRCKVLEDTLRLSEEKQISIYNFEVKDNQLIFSANYIGSMFHSALIGAFNVDTENIDWLHEVDLAPGEFVKEAPIVVENRIYLHTAENSLYVFELQEDV